MVEVTGFEPATFWSRTKRATKLRYTSTEREAGANKGTRTLDLRFTKPLLYQLSYIGASASDIITKHSLFVQRFLKKQQQAPGEARVTTMLFDDGYEVLHDRIDIQGVAPITENEYYVGGCTALLDAIGKTIDKIVNA